MQATSGLFDSGIACANTTDRFSTNSSVTFIHVNSVALPSRLTESIPERCPCKLAQIAMLPLFFLNKKKVAIAEGHLVVILYGRTP